MVIITSFQTPSTPLPVPCFYFCDYTRNLVKPISLPTPWSLTQLNGVGVKHTIRQINVVLSSRDWTQGNSSHYLAPILYFLIALVFLLSWRTFSPFPSLIKLQIVLSILALSWRPYYQLPDKTEAFRRALLQTVAHLSSFDAWDFYSSSFYCGWTGHAPC